MNTYNLGQPRVVGLWLLRQLLVSSLDIPNEDPGKAVMFTINPTSVKVIPELRVSFQPTQGGTTIIPWHSKELYSGYSRINLQLSGVGNVFVNRTNEGMLYTENQTIIDKIVDIVNAGTVPIFGDKTAFERLQKDRDKINIALLEAENSRKSNVYTRKRGLLLLFSAVNRSYVEESVDGEIQKVVWGLEWRTPVFSGTLEDTSPIYLQGYITAPMIIEENADNPFQPSWSLTFSIFDGEVSRFMEKVATFVAGMWK